MSKQYILAIDLGTSCVRALLINRRGGIKAISARNIPSYYPHPGWVEQDPNELLLATRQVIDEVIEKGKTTLHEVISIGITNQRETVVVFDKKSGKPLHNAIIWQDRRGTQRCHELKEYESIIKAKTGLLLDPYFSATKLEWLLEKTGKDVLCGTLDTFLVWHLTGGKLHITDATNASRTMLYNIHTGEWDDELLKLFNIPKEILPQVTDSSHIYGTTKEGVPISSIIGDQQAALFGHGCFKKGEGKITYGTGCFALVNTGNEPADPGGHLLTTIAAQINGQVTYALEGSVFIGGAAVSWLKDNLGILNSSSEVERLALSVSDSHGLCFVPSFTGLGAPYWKPNARGMILGITRGTTKAHLARATLEGIAHQVADAIEAMEYPIKSLKVDGGAVENDLLMQIQANYLGRTLIRPKSKEATALGAAFLSGLASGFWHSQEQLSKLWKKESEFVSAMDANERHKEKERWECAISCASIWSDSSEP